LPDKIAKTKGFLRDNQICLIESQINSGFFSDIFGFFNQGLESQQNIEEEFVIEFFKV
jgi:hypothetical protein